MSDQNKQLTMGSVDWYRRRGDEILTELREIIPSCRMRDRSKSGTSFQLVMGSHRRQEVAVQIRLADGTTIRIHGIDSDWRDSAQSVIVAIPKILDIADGVHDEIDQMEGEATLRKGK